MAFRVVRTAQASWQGTLPDGSGRIAVGSGAFDGPYSLRARVEDGAHATGPEELLGAAEELHNLPRSGGNRDHTRGQS